MRIELVTSGVVLEQAETSSVGSVCERSPASTVRTKVRRGATVI